MTKYRGNRTASFMQDLESRAREEAVSGTAPGGASDDNRPSRGGLASRLEVIQVVHGDEPQLKHYSADAVRLDPSLCRPWNHRDRDVEVLNETTCADLIAGFREAGRQTQLATLRPIQGQDEDVRYEIVAGVRRWWVAKFLGWQLVAEIRDLDDDEAFILSDVENRNRKDLSDWERAKKYRNALDHIYTQEAVDQGRSKRTHTAESLAQSMGMSKTSMSQLLAITKLPDEIVEAFVSPHDIVVNHVRRLSEYLADERSRRALIERARNIAGSGMDAKSVVKELEKAGMRTGPQASQRTALEIYKGTKGKQAVTVRRKGKDGLRFDLSLLAVADVEEALKLMATAVRDHFGATPPEA